jgi:hypothetical protein
LKYRVEKIDGPTDPNADYFVLRLDNDAAAMQAALAYAHAVEPFNPQLAHDLRERVGRYNQIERNI